MRLITTEVGRQPWIAHGILRTADAISPVTAASVLVTLVLFVIVYGIVFSMGLYYINRLIARGPQGSAVEASHGRKVWLICRPFVADSCRCREAPVKLSEEQAGQLAADRAYEAVDG